MVFKNKTLAPVSEVHHTNDVLVKYDPAVFKYAVETATEAMNEGTEYETDKLNIKVMKIRPEGDLTGAKVDNLITFEMSSKLRPEVKIKQQMHIYITLHSHLWFKDQECLMELRDIKSSLKTSSIHYWKK